MGGDERKSKRTVRDLSHLLISAEEKKKYLVLGCLSAGPEHPREEFEKAVSAFQAKNTRVTILGFPGPESWRSQEPPSGFPDSDFVRSNAVGTDVWLIELPWFLTEVGRLFAPKFDACIFFLKPSVASLKTGYRFLKALSPAFSGEVFIKWDPAAVVGNHRMAETLVSDLIKRFLGKTVSWISEFEQAIDKFPKISGNREEKDLDWLRESVAAVAGREPLSFYANGELTVTELEAFSALFRYFLPGKSDAAGTLSARI